MSDVWEFKNGVIRIVEMENLGGRRPQQLLVYLQTEELTTSHQMIEDRLRDEGWVHYPEMLPELIQYHRGPDDNYDRGPDDNSRFRNLFPLLVYKLRRRSTDHIEVFVDCSEIMIRRIAQRRAGETVGSKELEKSFSKAEFP
ncbi:hypothetical protein ZIOFF_035104 [Zingiber officinale]|uniref:Uncharacterized protein n=1 Tax=Zingiber officinale TaxID=94328 RepID=A0A8J5GB87_ZINOF|nr:hypothetical protein ZIOFF_035104 [Zingiber officinale]